MSAADDIYAFEQIFEDAAKALFAAQAINAFTSQDAPDFQKDRPRVEITFTPGAGQGRFIQINGEHRETAWKGQYLFRVVTDASAEVHNSFRSNVRAIVHGSLRSIAGTAPMIRHMLQPFYMDGGTSPSYSPQDGVYESQMTFDINFSVQADAWAALTT